MNYSTRVIHSGRDRDPFTGASSIPIHQVSTFMQSDPDHPGPYDYARSGNPTREALEHTIAVLEEGARGLAFASGMAATSSVILLLAGGDHIVASEDIYGGSYRVLTTIFKRWGLTCTFVDTTDLDATARAITPHTKAIFVETPSNPILKITDLAGIVRLAREHSLLAIVDNTFMSPYLQRPLTLGFDVVVHSATKFLGGHCDLIAGLAVTRDEALGQQLKTVQNAFGAILGPQDSWLTLRGIKTLSVRMEAQQKSAERIARWLTGRGEARKVYYPTLPGHPGAEVHRRQAAGGGAVIAFEMENEKMAKAVLSAVKLPMAAVSLGGVESILTYPFTMSHAAMPRSERERLGVTDSLLRLSVGLEAAEDLEADLDQAFRAARAS